MAKDWTFEPGFMPFYSSELETCWRFSDWVDNVFDFKYTTEVSILTKVGDFFLGRGRANILPDGREDKRCIGPYDFA